MANRLLVLFLFAFGVVSAQNSNKYPVRFSQYFSYLPIISPSSVPSDSKLDLSSGQQNYMGPFSMVRTLFATANATFKNGNENNHGIGLLFLSEKEGALLSLNRVYLQYAYVHRLSSNLSISVGVKAGMAKFTAEQTASSMSLSSVVPDGAVSIELRGGESRFGVCINQLLNSKLKADVQYLILKRYASFYGSKKKDLSPSVTFVLSYALRITSPPTINGDITPAILLKDRVIAGLGYGNGFGRGLSLFLGVKNLDLFGGRFSTLISYNSPYLSSTLANIQTVEVSVNFHFKSFDDIK